MTTHLHSADNSSDSQSLIDIALSIAKSDQNVLITGEPGIGKEILAQFIHDTSNRSQSRFELINCELLSNSDQSILDKLEYVQNGTLLLNEVSSLQLKWQEKLFFMLKEKQALLNIRVMAISNNDLKKLVENSKFQSNLYEYLNVISIHWQPLCDRKKDIIPMANYLIKKNKPLWKGKLPVLSYEAKKRLQAYHWPGNARELDNVIQRAILFQKGKLILDEDIYLSPNQIKPLSIFSDQKNETDSARRASLIPSLKAYEHSIILRCFQACRGDRQQMVKMLGITPQALRAKLTHMRERGILI